MNGSEPVNKVSPRISVFTDFLPHDKWRKVDEYCRGNTERFQFVGYSDKVGWQEHIHSTDPEIKYQRSFLTENGNNENATRHGDNYKISMHEPVDGDVHKILLWMLIKSRDVIKTIYGNDTYFESGPWLSMASEGDYMALHCDGVFLATEGASTDFSSVYYVNDDYEGGELYVPAIGLSIKPKANSLVIWSHVWHEDMAHGVKPITSGSRFMSQGFFWSV